MIIDSKKILIWTPSFYPKLGGLETVTYQLANYLFNRNNSVLVLTTPFKKSLFNSNDISEHYQILRCRHWQKDLLFNSPKNIVSSLRSSLMFKFQLSRISAILKDFNPDIVNIHFPNIQSVYFKELFKENQNIKLIASLHGHEILRWYISSDTDFSFSKIRVLNRIEHNDFLRQKYVLQNCSSVTVCSNWLAEKAIQLFPFIESKINTVYNGVDFLRFKHNYFIKDSNYIFAFGRLEHHKGFDLLLKSFAHVKQLYPNLYLYIAGSGPYLNFLKKLASDLMINHRINFLGALNQDEIAKYCNESNLIIIPSRREPFGISILEALASGRPVVATNVGGIPEIASCFNLKLYPDSVEGLISGINENIYNKINYSFDNNIFSQKFDIQTMLRRYEQLLLS